MLPEEDEFLHSRRKCLARLIILMAGRAAETVGHGDITSGAQGDIKAASTLVKQMVRTWGMCPKIPLLDLQDGTTESTLAEAEKLEGTILEKSLAAAEELLKKNITQLTTLQKLLIEKETVAANEARRQCGEIKGGKELLEHLEHWLKALDLKKN